VQKKSKQEPNQEFEKRRGELTPEDKVKISGSLREERGGDLSGKRGPLPREEDSVRERAGHSLGISGRTRSSLAGL